jgi:XamI restriction endonuclease
MTLPRWTTEQLNADAREAEAAFRRERLDEPLVRYSEFFNAFVPIFQDLIPDLLSFAKADPACEKLIGMVRGTDRLTAFRYLASPPISADDLKTLAETSLSQRALKGDRDQASRVRKIVLQILDPYRFPWIAERREPTDHERAQAVVASAALVAAKKVETARRKDSGHVQEEMVKALLLDLGLTQVESRLIPLLDDAPAPGQFCGESKLGDTKADVVVRLFDRRVLPVECKVSNSSTNSFKRLIHEAAGKAAKWQRHFGDRAVVPVAVLSGVFAKANLLTAQEGGLVLIWSHRLEDLATLVQSTRP